MFLLVDGLGKICYNLTKKIEQRERFLGWMDDTKITKKQLIKSESAFSFNFDGGNEIDAALLSRSINDIVELTKLTANLECKDAYIKIKISSFEKGITPASNSRKAFGT